MLEALKVPLTWRGMIYYYAPDAVQEWMWITPGSILATTLWLSTARGRARSSRPSPAKLRR
jgi:hypothetical protein